MTEGGVFEALKELIERADPKADAKDAALKLTRSGTRESRAFELSAEDIRAISGLNKSASEAIDLIDELSRYAAVERFGKRPRMESADEAGSYFKALCLGRHVEYCYLACLDASKRLSSLKLMGRGTLDAADVYVRNIASQALSSGAKYAVLAHNHPGGGLAPSQADKELTLRAIKALRLIGCELIEHVIVTNSAYTAIIGGGYV